MAELAAARLVLKLAWQLFAPKVAAELQKGDPTVDVIRNYLLSEFQKIHEHLNALRRKELAAAVNYMENAYSVLKSDPATSVEEFKKARDAAHTAFGVVADTGDRILATKIAVISTLHEFQDNMETCGNLCLKYLSRLNSMPEVIKAAEMVFEKSVGGKLFSLTGKATRRETLEGTAQVHKAAWDYFNEKGVVGDMNWPQIKLNSRSIHPVYDMIPLRAPRIVATMEDTFDGIVAAVVADDTFYIAGSNTSVPNTIAVVKKSKREVKYLVGHSGMVLCLLTNNDMLFSGSFDRTIMVWNMNTLECEKILTGHDGSVRTIAKSQKYLYSGAADSKIIVWDLESQEKCEMLDARKPVVSVKCSRKKFLYSMTAPASVLVWMVAAEGHVYLRKIDIPMSTKNMFLADSFLLACAKDRIEVWSLGSFTTDVKMEVDTNQVFLCQTNRYIITDTGGGSLQQFCIRSGKLVLQELLNLNQTGSGFEILWNNEGVMYGICRGINSKDFDVLTW